MIFSIQVLWDFSFVRRDSWVAESGMVTSSGLITCEKDKVGVPQLKHCDRARWRASVYTCNMFPTSCVSTLPVLQTTELLGPVLPCSPASAVGFGACCD